MPIVRSFLALMFGSLCLCLGRVTALFDGLGQVTLLIF